MTDLAFWWTVVILISPILGVRHAYKLADLNLRWVTFSSLLKSAFIVVRVGMPIPTVVVLIAVGPIGALLVFLVTLFFEAAVYAAEKKRHRKIMAQRLRQDRDLIEDHDEENSFRYFNI